MVMDETQFEVAKNQMVAAEESWVIWNKHQRWKFFKLNQIQGFEPTKIRND